MFPHNMPIANSDHRCLARVNSVPVKSLREIPTPQPRAWEKGGCVLARSWVFAALVLGHFTVGVRGGEPQASPSGQPEIVQLFNGRDFGGLTTWLEDSKHNDPRHVFRITDGVLHITGDGFGYLATAKEYHDYHLVVEYKWGKKTDGGKYVRNSGILLNAIGPDGSAGGKWMASIECQLAQGCVGDLIAIRGTDANGAAIPVTLTSETVLGPDKRPRWMKGGEPRVFTNRQLWWSRHDPDFQELLDTRGKNDVESPTGEWTRVDCRCAGNRITIQVNGVTVNECYDVFPTAGKILLQCEGFELFVRKFELHPLHK